MNRLGAIQFAQETNQSLTEFFSDDTPCTTTQGDYEQGRGCKQVGEITNEMREAL